MKLIALFSLWSICLIVGSVSHVPKEVAVCADTFVDSFGVNIHLSYMDTPYANFIGIKRALQDLGVRHVRDGLIESSGTEYYGRHNELGRVGIQGIFITDPKDSDSLLTSYPNRVHDSFEAYEAPNEYDINGGSQWVATLSAFMQRLHNVVKSNPDTARFPIIGPSFTQASSFQSALGIASLFDYGNLHNYFGGRNPGTPGWGDNGYGSIAWSLDLASRAWPNKPIFTTETGYRNDAVNSQGIPEDVSGTYLPRVFLEQWLHGIRRTYSYELIDLGVNHPDGSFGLLHSDLTPKPAFTAVHNLLHILADPGPRFQPQELQFEMTGDLTDVHHLLLEKRVGIFYLAIWIEEPTYDLTSKTNLVVGKRSISVRIDDHPNVTLYKLKRDGQLQSTALQQTQAHTVEISDHVAILEIQP